MLRLTQIFIALIILCLTAFAFNFFKEEALINDSIEYEQLALNLSEKGIHYAGDLEKTTDLRLYSKRPIIYPLYIFLSGFNTPILVIFTQGLLVLLLYLIGIGIIKIISQENRMLFVIYSIFYLSCIPLFITAQFIMADLLLAVFISLICYYALLYFKDPAKAYIQIIGVLWALALLCKPIMMPSVLIAAALFLYQYVKTKELSWSLLMPLSLVLIISFFNLQHTGRFHYSSISSINKLHYNSKLVNINNMGYDSTNSSEYFNLPAPASKEEYIEYVKRANASSKEIILRNKIRYIKLHMLGMIKSFIDPGRFELYTYWGNDTRELSLTELIYAGEYEEVMKHLRKAGLLFYLFLFLLVISIIKFSSALFSVSLFRSKEVWMQMLVVAYFIGLAGPIGAFRFLLPAIVPYLILASLGLSSGLKLFQKRAVG